MSTVRFQVPQAYLDLGISFFLHLPFESEAELKKFHVRETRRFHPDLLPPDASDEKREESEARLASLNAAYLKLRETSSRLDLVLGQIFEENSPLKESEKPQLPAALSMEYFELQEALEENPEEPATQDALKIFHENLVVETGRLQREIEKFLESTSFKRMGESVEVTTELVKNLAGLRNRQRYLDRLQADLEKKFVF